MKPKVYMTREISPESLVRVYDALGVELPGRTAVKISTGEPGGHNFLQPQLIKRLVDRVEGTIAECNTAYSGGRSTPKRHWKTFEAHGFKDIAPCDLLDEEGELSLSVASPLRIREDWVGSHLARYGSVLVLSHFKGHPMGGFGGALKNMAIGLASARGKIHIHSAGRARTMVGFALFMRDQDAFLESMADACGAVMDYLGREGLAYVNVANRLSVDCDCMAHPAEPEMGDLGVFASLDPVALDQACVDAVYAADDPGKAALIQRMESRRGVYLLEAAARKGLGVREYELVTL